MTLPADPTNFAAPYLPAPSKPSDIISGTSSRNWLVVAWFTPDYRNHAERLSKQLRIFDIPHHLFATDSALGTTRQITRQRPTILARAMKLYPQNTLVSLDIDCHVHGDISGLAEDATADITHYMKPRHSYRMGQRGRLSFGISDRVIVIRPTANAAAHILAWPQSCAARNVPARAGSEWARSQIMPHAQHVSFALLPSQLAGLEHDKAPPDAIITHMSENRRRNKQ